MVASSYLPYVGGVEEHVRHLAQELIGLGHRVEVWTVARTGRYSDRCVGGVRVRELPTPLPALRLVSLVRDPWKVLSALRRWQRAVRQFRPDVVNVQCFGPNGIYALIVARLFGRPLVVSTHGETFMDPESFRDSRMLSIGIGLALRQASATTACSAFTAATVAREYRSTTAIDVIANGVDLDEPGMAADADPAILAEVFSQHRTVFAVGRMEFVKGFDLLLEAFLAAKTDSDVHLVIAGDGPERERLQRRVRQSPAADRIHLPGRADREQVVSWMRAATVVVVPSRVEAFGIVVLEGMRGGRPVVATSVGGPSEILQDGVTGFLVDPTDTAALADRITSVLRDETAAARIGAAARQAVQNYTWPSVAARYESLFRSVLAGRRRR